ncbi:MAG: LysR family transcriptional regulator [Rhodopseudomonas sp.]|nr:LysR family transcriptional regulator [Rhodopseudomonas sp.]
MDLQQLRYFVSVAEVENISLAAHNLRVAQSAVSRQIRLLEDELGVVLLQRAGRGIRLTDSGERLRHRASDLIRQADDIRNDIRNRGTTPSGILRVGANASLGDLVFPSLAKSYTTAYPRVRLHLVTDMTMHIQDSMRKGTLDCGIVAFPDRDPSLTVQQVASEAIHLISHRKNDLDWGPVCTVKQLASVPLLLPGLPHRERLGYERLAAAKGYTLECRMEADSLTILHDLARLGLGHLLLPATAAFKLRKDGDWTSRAVSGFQLERFLIWHAERPITEAMNGFMKILTTELAGLTKQGILK